MKSSEGGTRVPLPYSYFEPLAKYYLMNRAYGKVSFNNELPAEGVMLTLPITQEELGDYTYDQLQKILERHLEHLNPLDIRIAFTSYKPLITLNNSFPYITSSCTQFVLIEKLLEKILTYSKKAIEDLKVLVIADDPDLAKLIVLQLYAKVNFLNVACDDIEAFAALKTFIYQECGLMLNVFEDDGSTLDGDFIINASTVNRPMYHRINKQAIIYDMMENKLIKEKIMKRRQDITFADNMSLNFQGKCIRKVIFDMLLYIQNPLIYRNLVDERYEAVAQHLLEVKDYIESHDVGIKRIYCGKQPIKREMLENTR